MKNNNYIIYKVSNVWTGEVYIGATTNSIHQRRLDHLERAKRGESGKFYVALASWTNAFTWAKIDTANDINDLAAKEKQYILQYNCRENGYNSDCGGGFQKSVYQYSLEDGSLVNTFDCLDNAANDVGAHKNSIAKVCSGENRTCKGFHWSYSHSVPFALPGDKRKKKVIHLDLNGNHIKEYQSVAEASRQTGISKSAIGRCCRSEREQTGGFLWKYA